MINHYMKLCMTTRKLNVKAAPISNVEMTYNEALLYCFLCIHDSHKDWRLPTEHEFYNEIPDANVWYQGEPFDRSTRWHVVPVRCT